MKILFICDGNVARSQEAESFVNKLADGKHYAMSAGVNPRIGKSIDPLVMEVMHEISFDMGKCVRKPIDKAVADEADLIISFKPVHELPEFIQLLDKVRHWDVADPRGQSLEFHRKTRDLVKSKVESLLAEME